MRAEAFIDTNILIYAISAHPAEVEKSETAKRLMASTDFGTSAQVLAEFYVTATRKMAQTVSAQEAAKFIERLSRLPVVAVDAHLVLEAIAIEQRHRISYWDAAIVAAAHRLGAKTIYSEDLNHTQLYGEVQVLNPFRTRK